MTMQGDLALMHANGATFAQVLDAHAHLLAEQITSYGAAHITPELDDIVEELANVIRPKGASDGPTTDQA